MAMDKRNYRQVVETTVDLGQKVGVGEIVERVVNNLKDESEAYRKMTLETVEKVIASLGAADIGERLEERLIDGVLHSFQGTSFRYFSRLADYILEMDTSKTRLTAQRLPES